MSNNTVFTVVYVIVVEADTSHETRTPHCLGRRTLNVKGTVVPEVPISIE